MFYVDTLSRVLVEDYAYDKQGGSSKDRKNKRRLIKKYDGVKQEYVVVLLFNSNSLRVFDHTFIPRNLKLLFGDTKTVCTFNS